MAKKKAGTEKPAPKKAGRKPILDAELVAAALVTLKGNLSAVARRFKVDRSSVQELIGKRPALRQILADAREGRLDDAEESLDRAVREAEGWAVCFILKTLGKSRGYVERKEVVGADDAPPVRVRYVKVQVIDNAPRRIGDGARGGSDPDPASGSGEGV